MNCLFDGKPATTNEEYKKKMLQKQRLFIIITALGMLTAVIPVWSNANSHTQDFYVGIGTGLFIAGLVKLFLNRRIIRNDTLLKKARLKNTDERNINIASKAVRSAAFTVLLGSYFAMLIGGLYNIIIFWCFWFVVMLFLFAYIVFTSYYNFKM